MGFKRIRVVSSLFFVFFLSTSLAQIKVGDNATSINSRSIFEMESTDKALYFPRLTSAQVAAQSGWQAGMLVYNSDSNCLYQYNGTKWRCLAVTSSYVEPWFGTDDDAAATSNTEDIYHLAENVGFGRTPSPATKQKTAYPQDPYPVAYTTYTLAPLLV